MMPKRWSDKGSGSTEFERMLLAHDPHPEPRPGDEQRVWQHLVARLPLPPGPGGDGLEPGPSPSEAPPTSAVGASAGKTASAGGGEAAHATQKALQGAQRPLTLLMNHGLGFAAGVVATAGVFLLLETAEPKANDPPATLVANEVTENASPLATDVEQRSPTAQAVAIEDLGLEPDEARPAPHRAPPPIPSSAPTALPAGTGDPVETASATDAMASEENLAATRSSQLREEALLIRQARERLGRGQLASAAEALTSSRQKFPDSLLTQERDALTVELLRRQGHAEEAAARARAFVRKYPHSPHARQVERAIVEHDDKAQD